VRYQRAVGQHFIFILDGFVGKPEAKHATAGSRAEVLVKF
jgi:hypothetical protein